VTQTSQPEPVSSAESTYSRPIAPETKSESSHWRQGDVFSIISLPFSDLTKIENEKKGKLFRIFMKSKRRRQKQDFLEFKGRSTPEGVALLSQTCDIVQSNRLTVLLSPVVILAGDVLIEATKGKRPRFVALPALGADRFVDLDFCATLHKDALVGFFSTAGVDQKDDAAVRTFGLSVARRFGRFPFPDEVVPWFDPLLDTIVDKYSRQETGLSLALKQVVEFRVHAAEGWIQPPYDVTLTAIVRAGAVPEIDEEDQGEVPIDLKKWMRRPDGTLKKSAGEIAARLFAKDLPPQGKLPLPTNIDRYHLWIALVEAWADSCFPRRKEEKAKPEVMNAIADGRIQSALASEDEYSLAKYRQSEQLDVEHLSPPTPS
jgi:hypothetical protein